MSNESKKRWVLPEDFSSIDSEKYGFDYRRIAPLLSQRGIKPTDVERFLKPSLSEIPDFTHLYNSKKAAKEIVKAVKERKRIYIHGDFDSDGICATSLLWEFLYKELSKLLKVEPNVFPYIPSRVDEGYGLSEQSIQAMLKDEARVIITVDCGIRDKELIRKYMSEGLHFIVTDHHQPPEDLLENLDYTVLHQIYPGHEYPFKYLCGTAIAFLLVQAIRAEIGVDHEISIKSKGLDLVALATVTDMMPLTDANRIFVKFGLEQMNHGGRLGIENLSQSAKVHKGSIDSYHLGFVIGPRINAAGRIGSALDAVRLLLTEDKVAARKYAIKLNILNSKRQRLTEEFLNEAKLQIDSQKDEKLNFVVGKEWPEGIIGLVAGKIQEYTGKPTIVVTEANGEIRGSARSLLGFNITEAIGQFEKYLTKYGGHEQAAGFNVETGELEKFMKKIQKFANKTIDPEQLVQELKIDLRIKSDELKIGLVNDLDLIKPFGYGNRKPNLLIESAVVIGKSVMGAGKNHLKINFKDNGLGVGSAVMFNCDEDIEKIQIDDVIDMVGSVNINEWNGNSEVQFLLSEWRKSNA